MRKNKAFTLLEILIVIGIISVILGFILFVFKNVSERSQHVEAIVNVNSIGKAEEMHKTETGDYIAADNIQQINERLGLEIEPKAYTYRVVGVTNDNFIVIAQKIGEDISSGSMSPDALIVADRSGIKTDNKEETAQAGEAGQTKTGGDKQGESAPPESGSPANAAPSSGGPGGGPSSGTPGVAEPGPPPPAPTPPGTPTGGGGGDGTAQSASLSKALGLLAGTVAGDYYYHLIKDNAISVVYTNVLPANALGQYVQTYWKDFYPNSDLQPNTIYINEKLKTLYTETQIAPVIIHEATHADYNYNEANWVAIELARLNTGRPPPPVLVAANLSWIADPVTGTLVLNDTVEEEYNCFKSEVLLWNQIHGSQRQADYDALLVKYNNDLANGTTEFYDDVASRYPNLNAY